MRGRRGKERGREAHVVVVVVAAAWSCKVVEGGKYIGEAQSSVRGRREKGGGREGGRKLRVDLGFC